MYKVEVSGKEGYLFNVRSKDYKFTIDLKGKGITPPDTLLASLGSCIGVYIRKYAEGSGLAVGELKIDVEAQFSKEAPFVFREIRVGVDLKGVSLDERRKAALLEFIKKCPVHNTLEARPEVSIRII